MPKRKPIRDIDEFTRVHDNFQTMMNDYFHTKRGRKVDDEIKSMVFDEHPSLLYATNMAARKAVAIASTQILRQKLADTKRRCYFVTIAFFDHCSTLDNGRAFNVKRVRDWATATFLGYNFLGIIEAAYFTNTQVITPAHSKMLSWHCHTLVWGIGIDAMRDIKTETNQNYTTLRPDGAPFHFKKVEGEMLVEQVAYMLKHAVNSYRIVPVKADIVDQETGEIMRVSTGRTVVKKRPLRQGEAVDVYKALGNRTVDELMFAGGTGKKVNRAILKVARKILVNR